MKCFCGVELSAQDEFYTHLRTHLPARSAYPREIGRQILTGSVAPEIGLELVPGTFHEDEGTPLFLRAPSAILDSLDIGQDTRVWANAHVSAGSVIGSNCTIGEGVHIGPHVVIGNGCKIQNGAQLFEGVMLEDDVFIGPHVVTTNVLTPRAFIDRKTEFKPTLVKRGASIGANATILCGVTIGEYAMVGAGAVVTRDVPPFTCVVGVPAEFKSYVCVCGVLMSMMTIRYGACHTCRRRYHFTGSAITPAEDAEASTP